MESGLEVHAASGLSLIGGDPVVPKCATSQWRETIATRRVCGGASGVLSSGHTPALIIDSCDGPPRQSLGPTQPSALLSTALCPTPIIRMSCRLSDRNSGLC